MPERLSADRPLAAAIPLLHLEVVTPAGRSYKDDVDEVVVPAAQGELGVLPLHRPLLTSMLAGSLRWRHGTEWFEAAVGAGFIEVGPGKVTLLCDKYLEADAIDPAQATQDLAKADVALLAFEGDPTSPARGEMERERGWALARLDVASRRKFKV